MRVILDTNVFVSGIFFRGPSYQVLCAWRAGKIELVLSQPILEEYRRVAEGLAELFPAVHLRSFLELIDLKATLVEPAELREPVCADPSDDMFIACALTRRGGIIISEDKHLLNVCGHRGIWILKPRTFVQQYLRDK